MNLKDLFEMPESVAEMTTLTPKRKLDENLYAPNLKGSNLDSYKARIRFIPNPENKMESIIAKYTYWLRNANGEDGIYVDCPSTIGEKSPIADLFFKYNKSANPIERKLSEYLKRNRQFFSLVQILQDQQHPELEGRIMVFRYGVKINEKISEEMNDKDDGGNPFDIMNGREFKLEIKMVGGYQNYDSCRFVGSRVPVAVDGNRITGPDSIKLLEKLYANAPDLNDYKYKPWTAEMTEQVNQRLRTFKQGFAPTAIENAMRQEDDDPVSVPVSSPVSSPVNTKSYDADDDGDDFLDGINL